MRVKYSKQISSFVVCMVLIVAMAFFTTGCNGGANDDGKAGSSGVSSVQTENPTQTAEVSSGENEGSQSESGDKSDVNVLGEGETSFDFSVTDSEGKETKFEIHTDKKTVGEALTELKLIDGDEGDFGLYVKTVNGITVDYDKDGSYWAFYVGSEYAQTGVDVTEIKADKSYSFKVEK